MLARAKTDTKSGTVLTETPGKGYCASDLQRDTFYKCFAAQTIWLMEWVSQTHYAKVQVDTCHINNIPVKVRTDPDNVFTWWVPLPHVGGVPLTNYSSNIAIDSST